MENDPSPFILIFTTPATRDNGRPRPMRERLRERLKTHPNLAQFARDSGVAYATIHAFATRRTKKLDMEDAALILKALGEGRKE